jgi:hypothetical protein
MVNMAMVWGNFYPIREKCNEITIYLDAIIWTISYRLLLLRGLVPRDCWLVAVIEVLQQWGSATPTTLGVLG